MTKKILRLRLKGLKNIEDMTEEEAKLLALLIDTEGSITVIGNRPKIYVGMRSLIPVDTAEKWGGLIYKRWAGGKLLYEWHLLELKSIRVVLLKIKSYLHNKQRQAELALELCDVWDAKPEGWKGKTKQLKTEISKLNHSLTPDIDITKLRGVAT